MAEKASTSSILARCVGRILRHPLQVLALVVLGVMLAGATGLPVLLTKTFLGALTEIQDGSPSADKQYAYILAGIFAAAMVVRAVLEYGQAVLRSYLTSLVAAELREEVMAKYLGMSLAYYSRKEAGDAVVRLSGDVFSVWRVGLLLCEMIQHPMVLLGAAGSVFWLNWRLGLIGFVVLPLGVYPIWYFSKRMRRYAEKGRRKIADVAKLVIQVFAGFRIVAAYGQEEAEARRFGLKSRSLMKAHVKGAFARAGARSAVVLLMGCAMVPVMVVATHLIEAGVVKIEDIGAIIAAFGFMRSPAKSLVKNNSAIQGLLPSTSRVFEVLDAEPDIVDAPDAVEIDGLNESFAFENVSFRYDRDVVLREVSFAVPAGTTCAVVGPSGAGKSSVLNLVPRLYDPTSGRVLIDGCDVTKVKMASLRAQIAVVTQDPFLFDTTIEENIRYGRPDAGQEEIEAAARAANIHDEIVSFPEGYRTIVGDRGLGLSGGQRQRVAIARAVLRGAPILILDEATSSLDSVSEREVQSAIDSLKSERTTFVVAHRLSTVSDADMIVVLESGQVEAIGTHEELLEKSRTYRRLWEAQQHRADVADEAPPHAAPFEMLAADPDAFARSGGAEEAADEEL